MQCSVWGFYNIKETPFTAAGFAIKIHEETKNKKLIGNLPLLQLCINYEKLIKIEKEMLWAKKLNWIQVYKYLVIANVYFKNDTPNRKREFHSNGITIFQKPSNKKVRTLEIKRPSKTKLKLKSMFIPPWKHFIKPIPLLEHFPNITSTVLNENIGKKNKLQYRTWALF